MASNFTIKAFQTWGRIVYKNWLSNFGKQPDGQSIMKIEKKDSWRSPEEIKERRENMGVKRGMKCYE